MSYPTLALSRRLLPLAAAVALSSLSAHAQTIFTDNFITDTLSGYTIMGGPSANVTWSATEGVGGGGGLVIAAGANPSTSLIPTSTSFTLAGTSSVTLSMMLRATAAGSGSRVYLGVSNQNNYAWGAGPATNSASIGGAVNTGYQLTARRTTSSSVENIGTPVTFDPAIEAPNWYKFTVTLTKPVSGVVWTFDSNFEDYGSDGTTPIGSLASITSYSLTASGNGTGAALLSDALTSTFLNFGVRNASFDRMDSFSVTAIPEPSSFAALAGIVGLGWVATRRRRA